MLEVKAGLRVQGGLESPPYMWSEVATPTRVSAGPSGPPSAPF